MESVRILGLDPGLRHTGWGIIQIKGNSLSHVAHGVVDTPSDHELAQRLSHLYKALNEIITSYAPDEAAVEETFVNKNPVSTLKLGMARGVVLLAPAALGVSVFEYSANKVKKSVVGVGHADKSQVLMMVKMLLPVLNSTSMKADAADALAVAICHSHHRHIHSLTAALKAE